MARKKKYTRKAQSKALTIEQHNVLCLERREKLYHKTVIAEIAAYTKWIKCLEQRHEAFKLLLEAKRVLETGKWTEEEVSDD